MTPYAQRQIAQQRTAARFPYLIKITHPEYPPFLYANASANITYNGEIYNAASFSVQPPDREGAKIGDATLTISAVDQVWPEKIRNTQQAAELRFIALIVYDEAGIAGIEALDENKFTLRAANWTETAIQWSMNFDERMGYIITSIKCTPQICPGLG
jgi:hypothetical protein